MSYEAPLQKEFTQVAFLPEANFGAAGSAIAGTNMWIGILQDEQEMPWPDRELEVIYSAGNTVSSEAAGPLPFDVIEKKTTYQGSLKWMVQNGQLMHNIFGKKIVSGSDPYTHTFTTGVISARPLESISLAAWIDKDGSGYTADKDQSTLFTGVKLGSTTFNFEEGEPLTVDSSIFGILSAVQTAFPTGFAKITTKPYLMSDGTLTLFGAAFARVQSGSITINHNIEEKWYFGSRNPKDLIEKRITMDGSLTVVLEDDTLFDLLLTTAVSTRLSLIFTRGANDTFTIESEPTGTTTELYYKLKPQFGGGEGAMTAEVELIFKNLQVVVVDSNASYPV